MKIEEEILRTELMDNQLTQKELAKKLGVKVYSIIYWIRKYNLLEEIKLSRTNGKRTQIVGDRYGYLTVISYNGTDNWGKSEWNCECSCGNKVVVGITRLNMGITKSCGCYRASRTRARLWKGHGEISMDFFSTIRRNAEIRNLEFNITIEFVWKLFQEQKSKCALTGCDITLYCHKRNKIRRTASLDRIDNNIGYIEGNVQWVHKHMNTCKNTYGNEEFIKMCNKVAKLHPR